MPSMRSLWQHTPNHASGPQPAPALTEQQVQLLRHLQHQPQPQPQQPPQQQQQQQQQGAAHRLNSPPFPMIDGHSTRSEDLGKPILLDQMPSHVEPGMFRVNPKTLERLPGGLLMSATIEADACIFTVVAACLKSWYAAGLLGISVLGMLHP